jgi:hypothetical protein
VTGLKRKFLYSFGTWFFWPLAIAADRLLPHNDCPVQHLGASLFSAKALMGLYARMKIRFVGRACIVVDGAGTSIPMDPRCSRISTIPGLYDSSRNSIRRSSIRSFICGISYFMQSNTPVRLMRHPIPVLERAFKRIPGLAFDARVLERAIKSAIGLDNPVRQPVHILRVRDVGHMKNRCC